MSVRLRRQLVSRFEKKMVCLALGIGLLALTACSGPEIEKGRVGYVEGFLGLTVAEEPRAALMGREILSAGGTAADAAVAMATTLAVTLPGSASLGGGGACVMHIPPKRIRTVLINIDQGEGAVDSLVFLATTADAPGGLDAAVPAMPRGLFALHAKYGQLSWASLISPAEGMARFGSPVSRATARHLQEASGIIAADPELSRVFRSASGQGLPKEGERLIQLELAAQLGRLRAQGAGDAYIGQMARNLVDAAPSVGAAFSMDIIGSYQPVWTETTKAKLGNHEAHFPSRPYLGGEVAARMLEGLIQSDGTGAVELSRRVLRQTTGAAEPSATGFAVVDRDAMAVACTLTTNGPFGTGRMPQGLGYVLASSAGASQEGGAGQAPMVVFNPFNQGFYLAATGAGGALAPTMVADLARRVIMEGERLSNVLASDRPTLAGTGSGLVNAIACPEGIPPNDASCVAGSDPKGAGLALRGAP